MRVREKIYQISAVVCGRCPVKNYAECEKCEFHRLINEVLRELAG